MFTASFFVIDFPRISICIVMRSIYQSTLPQGLLVCATAQLGVGGCWPCWLNCCIRSVKSIKIFWHESNRIEIIFGESEFSLSLPLSESVLSRFLKARSSFSLQRQVIIDVM